MDAPVRRPGERPPGDFVNHSDTSPELDLLAERNITIQQGAKGTGSAAGSQYLAGDAVPHVVPW